ncbi:hypothetical protein P691DRAFT_810309 [Macrolepiota fuliginosa MF-IS2]|uniref:Large ribosomal subunit protein uL30m n=1 Tax=Macrolepiota fuliginosa MF-IS2 TaxID=1400762 RepID=A0A9P6C649_9AGAR|nr:hypothetical protein P691DRAFT_810309 [Macrolepiota fuliginosa MF-IS2]
MLARSFYARTLTTASTEPTPPTPSTKPEAAPLTHYKVTLRRSGISLGDKIKGTLEALGFHKRNQTVYHKHSSDIAGKILKVKELVEVENVPSNAVRSKWQQRQERKAVRGYKVVGSRRDTFMHI